MFSNTRIRLIRLAATVSNDSNIDRKTFTLGGMAYVLVFQQIPSNRCHVGRRRRMRRRMRRRLRRRERRFIVLIYTMLNIESVRELLIRHTN